jgi:hypothetical protein
MFAVVDTKTKYHPRSSGPAYGVQFRRLREAHYALKSTKSKDKPITAVINGDVELEVFLYAETDRKGGHIRAEYVQDIEKDEDDFCGLTIKNEPGQQYNLLFDEPTIIESADHLIKWWWDKLGQYAPHPWDPDGICEYRRLGLKRQEKEPDFFVEDWAGFHETDKRAFAAYDNKEYERKPMKDIWNEVCVFGFQWWR